MTSICVFIILAIMAGAVALVGVLEMIYVLFFSKDEDDVPGN